MRKISVRYADSLFLPSRLRYVLGFLNEHPLNTYFRFYANPDSKNELNIDYGIKEEGIYIPMDAIYFQNNSTKVKTAIVKEYHWEGKILYAVEDSEKTEYSFFQNNHFAFDIFNTIFFLISRYEEVFATEDQYGQAGWLQEDQHFLVRNGLQDRPVVDDLVLAFLQALGAKIEPAKTTYDLSHDVDILGRFTPFSKLLKSIGATFLYRRGVDQFLGSLKHYQKMIRGEVTDPYDTFDYLLRAEESPWQSKHIYFMAGGNSKYDNHYQLSDKRLDRIIEIAKDRGYEIGLHPSYNAGFEEEMYTQEKSALEKRIGTGINLNRQHWLRFNWQITPEIWIKNGITQDASMGYNRYLGFRCGTGFAYQMYDFKREQAYEWKEQPMVFMESSAIHQAKSSGASPAFLAGRLSELMKAFLRGNKFGTHISFNFHNSNFDPTLETGRTLTHFYKNELLTLLEED